MLWSTQIYWQSLILTYHVAMVNKNHTITLVNEWWVWLTQKTLTNGTMKKFVRSGIRTHAYRCRLRPERSALDHSAILTIARRGSWRMSSTATDLSGIPALLDYFYRFTPKFLFSHNLTIAFVWPSGLGVWFSLRVREVPGSNPGLALFCTSHFRLDSQ